MQFCFSVPAKQNIFSLINYSCCTYQGWSKYFIVKITKSTKTQDPNVSMCLQCYSPPGLQMAPHNPVQMGFFFRFACESEYRAGQLRKRENRPFWDRLPFLRFDAVTWIFVSFQRRIGSLRQPATIPIWCSAGGETFAWKTRCALRREGNITGLA